jgi:hypothetical protein
MIQNYNIIIISSPILLIIVSRHPLEYVVLYVTHGTKMAGGLGAGMYNASLLCRRLTWQNKIFFIMVVTSVGAQDFNASR